MFSGAKFHFIKRINGKKYVDEIPIKQLQIQLFRMELEEVDAVIKEIKLNSSSKIFLELDPVHLAEVLKPLYTKLMNERFVQENLKIA